MLIKLIVVAIAAVGLGGGVYVLECRKPAEADLYSRAAAQAECRQANASSGCARCTGVIRFPDGQYQPQFDYAPCTRGLAKAFENYKLP